MAAVPAVAYATTGSSTAKDTNDETTTAREAQLRRDAGHELRTAIRRARHQRAGELRRRRAARRSSVASPALQAIAACESGGNPRAIGGGGAYRGKYQFDYGTWASVGGSGDPAAAPEAEQDRRAAVLLARSGSTPWPVCGR